MHHTGASLLALTSDIPISTSQELLYQESSQDSTRLNICEHGPSLISLIRCLPSVINNVTASMDGCRGPKRLA